MRTLHDADRAVILDMDTDHDRRIACTCRERMRKKLAKRPRNTNERPIFDGAVGLGDGNYWTRPLGSNNDGC
jgi:hypothetical protein